MSNPNTKRTPEQQRAIDHGTILEGVAAERDYQRERWGDEHDDLHTYREWNGILNSYMSALRSSRTILAHALESNESRESVRALSLVVRRQSVKVVALLIAMDEWLDRLEASKEPVQQ